MHTPPAVAEITGTDAIERKDQAKARALFLLDRPFFLPQKRQKQSQSSPASPDMHHYSILWGHSWTPWHPVSSFLAKVLFTELNQNAKAVLSRWADSHRAQEMGLWLSLLNRMLPNSAPYLDILLALS